MSNYMCRSCRFALLRTSSQSAKPGSISNLHRKYSSDKSNAGQESTQPQGNAHPTTNAQAKKIKSRPQVDATALLATPSWSVRSLLPESDAVLPPEDEITTKKLHHLLRLSALPLPKTEQEEQAMIATLRSQLHFVRDIQKVDTDGIKPLQSIRDETEEGIREITIGMESLKEAFSKEEIRGHNRRPRRRRIEGHPERVVGVEDWDPLSTARDVVERGGGKYFVVRSGKGPASELKNP